MIRNTRDGTGLDAAGGDLVKGVPVCQISLPDGTIIEHAGATYAEAEDAAMSAAEDLLAL